MKFIPFVFPASLFLLLMGCAFHEEGSLHIKSATAKTPSFVGDITQTPIHGWSPVLSNAPYFSYIDSKTINAHMQEKTVHVVTVFSTGKPFIIQSLHRFDCSKQNTLTALQLSIQEHQQKTLNGSEQSLMEMMKSEPFNRSIGESVCQYPEKLMARSFPETNPFVFADVLKKSSQHSFPTISL